MGQQDRSLITKHGEAESIRMGGVFITHLISGETTGGAYSLIEVTIPSPPATTGLHLLKDVDELSYFLEGTIHCTIGDHTKTITSGSTVFVPKGTPHEFANAGPGPVKLLRLYSPAGFEDYYREVAQFLNTANGPPDSAVLTSLQQKYNMVTVHRTAQGQQ